MNTITKVEDLGELILSYPLLSFLQHYTLIVIRSVDLKLKYFADIFSTFKGGSIPKCSIVANIGVSNPGVDAAFTVV